ncbi:MAG: transcriptional repressor LexA [Eubacteriales bacterium]|nr:transcriptional repressor LexA [Eubacteriales bacterium]
MVKSEKRIQDICKYIEEYQFEFHRSPTMDLIADAVGTVKSNIYKYLSEMENRNIISRNGRSITVNQAVKAENKMNRVPVLGTIACGQPSFAEEDFEEYIPLPVALFGKGDFFILHTSGESMIEAGIDPGDIVVVRKQNTANEGDIVVALVGSETTLKRYYIDERKKCVRLHPANSKMKDIFVKECRIQGVAEHVIKAL